MIYAHLLRAEATELAKDKAASWDRIMEIRHLKDRMIRKCQRLSRGATARDRNTSRVMFFTVHAPPDFRMKEMERWFRGQGGDISNNRAMPSCCDKCGPLLPPQPSAQTTRAPQPPRRSHSASRSTRTKVDISERIPRRPSASQLASASRQTQAAPTPEQKQVRPDTSPPPLLVPVRSRSLSRSPNAPRQRSSSRTPPGIPVPDPARQPFVGHNILSEHPPRATVQSPDPLPIPYRAPHESEDELEEEIEVEVPVVDRSPSPVRHERDPDEDDDLYADPPLVTPPILRTPDPDQTSFPILETIHEMGDLGLGMSRPTLPRRRSSLKKSGSMSRLSMVSQTKSVTWAMDKDWLDQMTKFVEVTREAETFGKYLTACSEFSLVTDWFVVAVSEGA